MNPDEMIAKILDPAWADDPANDGTLANDLLSAFWRGYPIENLGRLFDMGTGDTAGVTSFLVAELGRKARPFIRQIATLLDQESPRTRGDAIGALSQCVTWEDGWAVALVLKGLADPHPGVRYMAARAVSYMESDELFSGLEYLRETEPHSVYAKLRDYFRNIERKPSRADSLQQLLRAPDIIARRFGAALAGRPRLFIDPELMGLALASEDEEVRQIAQSAAELPKPPWAEWTGSPPRRVPR